MHGLFDPIHHVDLDDVRAFLDDAGEEGLTWEAKADEDDRRQRAAGEAPGQLGAHTIRKAVCGFANAIGGYVIIGARSDRKTGTWSLPGVQIADPEPEGYLRRIIDGGVRPVPRYQPKTWRLADGSTVALIEVEPIAEPPCITSGGQVYERVSGETHKVTDPAHLDSLLKRGRNARRVAEDRAGRAVDDVADAIDLGHGHGAVVVAVAPVARETDDITSRIFVLSFNAALDAALKRLLPRHGSPDQVFPGMSEASIVSQAVYRAALEPDEPFDTPLDDREIAKRFAIGGMARWWPARRSTPSRPATSR